MALWILNRPKEHGDLTELRVADLLAGLSDDWVVRWGFHYQDNAGTTREGDFLVLGPDGGLMVLEVKSGTLDVFPRTGCWDTEGRDHPLHQLDAEWKAVLKQAEARLKGGPVLVVLKALALPKLKLMTSLKSLLQSGVDRFYPGNGEESRAPGQTSTGLCAGDELGGTGPVPVQPGKAAVRGSLGGVAKKRFFLPEIARIDGAHRPGEFLSPGVRCAGGG
jgi:hypothetical protein